MKAAHDANGSGIGLRKNGMPLAGIENDCTKYAEGMLRGWQILRVTPKQIKNGQAIAWIEKLLAAGGPSAQGDTTSER